MNQQRIVIAGGTGLLGSACATALRKKGYHVQILSRSTQNDPDIITWDPAKKTIGRNVIDGAFAVINLTGTPLDGKRWTDSYKKVLTQSRVAPARYLASLIEVSHDKPKVYVGAAGIGFYGDSGDKPVGEDYIPKEGDDFITQLSDSWEKAHPTTVAGMRSVIFRIAVVLSSQAGFVPRVLEPARTGVYGYFGEGSQYMGWIHISDLARTIVYAIENDTLDGTYNAAAGANRLKQVMQMLKKVKGGIGFTAGIPYFVARVVLGEMADLLMWSCYPDNSKMRATGFNYDFPTLESALRDLLK